MSQRDLRRRIANLEELQRLRRERIAAQRDAEDRLLEEKDRELDNLRAQQTIGSV